MSDPESKKQSSEQETPTEEFLVAMAYVSPSGLESLYPPTTHDIVGPLDQLAIPDYSVFEPLIEALPPSVMTAEQLFEALAAEEPPIHDADTADEWGVIDTQARGTDATQPARSLEVDDATPVSVPQVEIWSGKGQQFAEAITNYDKQQILFNFEPRELVLTMEQLEQAGELYHQELKGDFDEMQPDQVVQHFLALAYELHDYDPVFFFDDEAIKTLVTLPEKKARVFANRYFLKLFLGDNTEKTEAAKLAANCMAIALELRKTALWLMFSDYFHAEQIIVPYPIDIETSDAEEFDDDDDDNDNGN